MNRRTTWLPVALLVGLIAAGGNAWAYPGQSVFEEFQGQRAYERGDFSQAAEHFAKASELNPTSARLRYNQALALLQAGEREKAKELFKGIFDPGDRDTTQKALTQLTRLDHEDTRKSVEPLLPYWSAPERVNPEQAEKLRQVGQEALKNYDGLLEKYRHALATGMGGDELARNYEVAWREREAIEDFLRRLPEPPPPPQSQQSQQNQQNQQQKNENKNEQQQQQQQENSSQDQQQRQSQADQQKRQSEQSQQQSEQQPNAPENKPDKSDQEKQKDQSQQGASSAQQARGEQSKDQEAAQKEMATQLGQMSPDEARRLLNSLPEDDKRALLRLIHRGERSEEPPSEYDW